MQTIFISGVDSYVGRWVAYRFATAGEDGAPIGTVIGTTANGEKPSKYVAESMEVGSAAAVEAAMSARVVVLDMVGQAEEAASIVAALAEAGARGGRSLAAASDGDGPAERVVIGLSTVMTWQQSKRPKATGRQLVESRYKRRRADPDFEAHRLAEGHLMALRREGVRPVVVACGIPYGHEQGPLHFLFRQAWMSEAGVDDQAAGAGQEEAGAAAAEVGGIGIDAEAVARGEVEVLKASPVVVPALAGSESGEECGRNFVPLIHVNDLAAAVQAIADGGAEEQEYVVAVDPSQVSLKQAATAVARSLGDRQVAFTDRAEAERRIAADGTGWLRMLQCDMRFDMGEAAIGSLGLEWHCEEGLVERAADMAAEFVAAKDLRPVRCVVVGPPAVGKSTAAAGIAEAYHLPLVTVDQCVRAIRMAGRADPFRAGHHAAEGQDGEEGAADAEGQEEATAGGGGGAGEDEDEDGEAPAGEPAEDEAGAALAEETTTLARAVEAELGARPRLRRWLLGKVVRWYLSRPRMRNRGWVLDSFPRSFAEAEALLREDADEQEDEGEEAAEADEGGEEDAADDDDEEEEALPCNKAFLPTCVVLMDAPDQVLAARAAPGAAAPAEGEAAGGGQAGEEGSAADRFQRRLGEWRKVNRGDGGGGKKGVAAFMEGHAGVVVVEKAIASEEEAAPVEQLVGSLAPFLEAGGKPFNFRPTEAEAAAAEAAAASSAEAAAASAARQEAEQQQQEERERERKEAAARARLETVASYEAKRLEERTQPLREYLAATVMPTLSKGLMEVVRAEPEDPVDFLAEFLFQHAAVEGEAEAGR